LVGVAIAASLLPPICNAGMCISYGLLSHDYELLDIGAYSLALFVINFVMIFRRLFLSSISTFIWNNLLITLLEQTQWLTYRFILMNIFKSRKSSTWKGLSKVKAEQMVDPSFHAPINVITNDSEESLPLLANVERESLPLLANVDQATEAMR
jgi:hypothetical protein